MFVCHIIDIIQLLSKAKEQHILTQIYKRNKFTNEAHATTKQNTNGKYRRRQAHDNTASYKSRGAPEADTIQQAIKVDEKQRHTRGRQAQDNT